MRERLDRVRDAERGDLAERLLAIGRDCAAHMRGPRMDHGQLAILGNEPEARRCVHAIAAAPGWRMSAANFVEAAVVVDTRGDAVARRRFDDVFRAAAVAVEPVTEAHARIAREAYRDFGRGSGPPARLNFGDCFAYALARESDEPLLFVGDDFVHTDVVPA